jgi:DnaJ-domain-containing protein 1
MTPWQVAIIVGCAVIGFIVVSLIVEAAGWKAKPADRPGNDFGNGSSRSGDEPARQATWFEVLGVQPTASIDEIKAAFRQRARQYHPDRVEGLGPELREIAEKRMKQLNEAYNCAVRSR